MYYSFTFFLSSSFGELNKIDMIKLYIFLIEV